MTRMGHGAWECFWVVITAAFSYLDTGHMLILKILKYVYL